MSGKAFEVFSEAIDYGCWAIAQVVALLIAVPANLGRSSGDGLFVYRQVGGHCVGSQRGEVAHSAPAALVLFAAHAAHVGAISGAGGESGESQGSFVGLNGSHFDGIGSHFTGSINHFPQVLFSIASSPGESCTGGGDVACCEVLRTWAANLLHKERGEHTSCGGGTWFMFNNHAFGASDNETAFGSEVAADPLDVVGETIAQRHGANDGFILAARFDGERFYDLAIFLTYNLNLVAVPAVAVGVGERIFDFALVGVIAHHGNKRGGSPGTEVAFAIIALHAHIINGAVAQVFEVEAVGVGNASSSPVLVSSLLILYVPSRLGAARGPSDGGTVGGDVACSKVGGSLVHGTCIGVVGKGGHGDEVALGGGYIIQRCAVVALHRCSLNRCSFEIDTLPRAFNSVVNTNEQIASLVLIRLGKLDGDGALSAVDGSFIDDGCTIQARKARDGGSINLLDKHLEVGIAPRARSWG